MSAVAAERVAPPQHPAPPAGGWRVADAAHDPHADLPYRCPARWTEAQYRTARRMWFAGCPVLRIAAETGLTKNQVVGVRNREGWPARPSPIGPRRGGSQRRGAAELAQARARAATREIPRGDSAPVRRRAAATRPDGAAGPCRFPGPAVPASPPPPPAEPLALAGRGCRYPLWGDDERPAYGEHRFCEAPRRPGTPYCAAHAAVCYARAVAAPDAALAARRGARIGRPAP